MFGPAIESPPESLNPFGGEDEETATESSSSSSVEARETLPEPPINGMLYLPRDLLKDIFLRVPMKSIARSRMCNLEVMAAGSGSDEMRSECKSTPPLPMAAAAPWLVIPYGEGKQNQAFYNICDEESNISNSRKSIPELNGKTFWQKPSHQGWLIVLCNDRSVDYCHQGWNYGDCFLWNPESFESIQLPSLLHWIEEYGLKDCVLSLPPNGDWNDSMVLFLFSPIREETKPLEYVLFLFCHPGDKQWRMKQFYGVNKDDFDEDDNRDELWNIEYLQCFKGKLYVMSVYNPQLEISLGDDNVTLSIRSFEVSNTFFHSVGHISSESFYVESSDDFFRIDMYFGVRGYRKGVVAVNVMRLDFSLMEWSVVDSFGDHVLFISENTRACCSAADLGFTRGCLYYTLPEDQSLYKFEIESNGNRVILPCRKLATPWFSPNWIMMPNAGRRRRRREGYLLAKYERDCIIAAIENQIRKINNDKNETLKEKQDVGEIKEARTWDILNGDMVAVIANFLHPFDYVHFRSVCRANRAMMPLVKPAWSSIGTTNLYPSLLFSRDNKCTTYNFINPMHNNENYLIKFSELLQGATIRFQKGGWLLMSKGTRTLFFYNPFTKDIIKLPDFPVTYQLPGICFSTSPTSVDCIVFAIQQCGDKIRIWVMIGDTESWDFVPFENPNTEVYSPSHNTPIYYNGAFYSVDYNGNLGVFNFDGDNPEDMWKVYVQPSEQFNDAYASFLVECGGDLLLVKLGHLEGSVRVFKLDFTGMQWVQVESLGKHMLFISCTSCCSAIAPDSRMENKIYFPRFCLKGGGILFYSLDTGTYHSDWNQHTVNNLYDTEGWHINCTWIEPNWSKSSTQ